MKYVWVSINGEGDKRSGTPSVSLAPQGHKGDSEALLIFTSWAQLDEMINTLKGISNSHKRKGHDA